MNLLVIGSGGREHAICESINNSNKIDKIFCFPGNAGTENIAENVNIDLENFEELKNYILSNNINLIVVGPEKPLVNGLVDYLEKFKIKVFGPNKVASKLEGSKIFTKQLCKKYNIPTAKFGIFENKNEAKQFIKNSNFPTVIKADNLASGKGVYICNNTIDAEVAINEIFDGKFGKAENLLIEEFLIGEEMSFFTIHDGKVFKCFDTAQDHKRVLEGDKGKNTGGMGAYSPSRLINKDLEEKIINKICQTVHPAGIVATCYLPNNIKIKGSLTDNWVYLDRVSDPGNLGTLLRTAAWFGVKNIALSTKCTDPFNPKVVRSGMGAHFLLNIFMDMDLFEFKKNEYCIIGADQNGSPVYDFNFINDKWILVIGNEGHGISKDSKEHIEHFLSIPSRGSGNSLNAAVAGGILIHHLVNYK